MTTDAPVSGIDVRSTRRRRNWSRREQVLRVFWSIASIGFRLTPRPFWSWRRAILRAFGARVGTGTHIYPSVRIAVPWTLEIGEGAAIGDRANLYSLGQIRIGRSATISQGAHLCAGTHDLVDPARRLLRPPITVGDGAWICADAFVGPGVTIGAHAVVGARAVVVKNVEARMRVAGNPARVIGGPE